MKKFKMPTAYTILFALIIVVAVFTWIIPSGQYDYTVSDDGTSQPIAGTYHEVEPNPQGPADVITAPFKGFYSAVDVCLFIMMVGGFLGVVMKTGAIDAGIANVINKLNGKEKFMIPILMVLFSLGGTSYGMWEETMAFYPLLLPVFLAAGYDSIVAVSVVILGAGTGVLCSTVNPFATGIASGFAGISLGEGITLRVIMLIVMEIVAIIYVMRYAEKVKKDPQKSFVYDSLQTTKDHFCKTSDGEEGGKLTTKRKITLALFAATFIMMIYSVIPFADMGITVLPTLGWWFSELSGLFLVAGLVIGIFSRMKEEEIADNFVAGASDLLGVGLIIGISRGITEIMNSGFITDTILYWGETALQKTSSIFFIILTYLLYLPLSILIPSSSGLATLSIPIMAPLGQFAHVNKDLIITAYQSASGIINLVTPTSAVIMGALAIGKVPYDRWLKYIWKLLLIFFVMTIVFLGLGVTLGL